MDTSSLDQPTLRIQIDRLTADKAALTARLNEEVTKLETVKNTIEQYRGALSYNHNLIESITKELDALNKQAFSSPGRSIKDELAAAAKQAESAAPSTPPTSP